MKNTLACAIAVFLVLSVANVYFRHSAEFSVQARSCAEDCDCTERPTPSPPDPDCDIGALCREDGCNRPPPLNVCCVPGSGESVCQGERIWTYFHNAECLVDRVDPRFVTDCSYHWEPVRCPVTDSCMGQTGLRPGKCTSDGCAIGASIYKTCCNAYGQAVTCFGGEYEGICTPNQTVWGTGVSSDCAGSSSSAPPGNPTATPIPQGCDTTGWGGPCSNWNGNASGCWSNGQFDGAPSCNYCSNNTCTCGACDVPPTGCQPGEFMCQNNGSCCRNSSTYNFFRVNSCNSWPRSGADAVRL